MSTHRRPSDMTKAISSKLFAIDASVVKAFDGAKDKTLEDAKRFTTGPYRSSQLKAMGHPYARNREPYMYGGRLVNRQTVTPTYIINIDADGHNGRLHESFRFRHNIAGPVREWELHNDAEPDNIVLKPQGRRSKDGRGSTMITRGFMRAINARYAQRIKRTLRRAMKERRA